MLKKILDLFDRDRPASAATDEEILHDTHDPYEALRSRDFRLWSIGGFFAAIGQHMFATAIGWELYEKTHNVWTAVGLTGLIEAAPVILLVLPAGHLADRHDRRKIVLITQVLTAFTGIAFAGASYYNGPVSWFYLLLGLNALAEAVKGPARQALLPQLVSQEALANAVSWNSSRWQTAAMIGPMLGGAAIGMFHKAWPVYMIAFIFSFTFLIAAWLVKPTPFEKVKEEESIWQSLAGGVRFVRDQKIILATITLDMLAVLVGGAVSLLPVIAKDVLHVGPGGLGWLRAAPAVGAFASGLWISYRPPMKRAGSALMWAVAGFGAATIVFGLSKNFFLSLLMLALTGACDQVSVVVRHTLVQVLTPNHMQGRVSAVNSVFIGSSNELGAVESGAVAKTLGPVTAVVAGGIGTILVVLGVAAVFPQITKLGSLADMKAEEVQS